MRSDMLVEKEIQTHKTQNDSGKLLTCVFFQQFVNARLDEECPDLEHKIPELKHLSQCISP